MKIKHIAQAAVIAAIYALLTVCVAPIASGLIQCRISEALCVLPLLTPAAIPGLFIGCLISNLLTGALVYDVVFGSLATLLAAVCTWLLGRVRIGKYLAPLPAIVCNGLVVGALLVTVYGVPVPYWTATGAVALGEAVAGYAAGLPLLLLLEKKFAKML